MELGLNATDKTNIQKDGLWEDGWEMAIRKCFIKEKKNHRLGKNKKLYKNEFN